MPIISVIIVLIVIGVLMWLVNTMLPIADPWKTLINVVAVLFTVLWLLSVLGIFTGFEGYRVGPPIR